ncbi:MAG TPA: hypothetical protein VFG07_03815 [Thermoplasmata archaeon]|nr:hypothetical protein [Thermoplasmata archaeon]
MAGADAASEEDSSHVVYLFRSVRLTQTALGWYLAFALLWFFVSLADAPMIGAFSSELAPGSSAYAAGQALAVFAIVVSLFGLAPVAAVGLYRWRIAIRAFARDLPTDSPWSDSVLGPSTRALRVAAGGLIAAIAFAGGLIALAEISTAQYNSGVAVSTVQVNSIGVALVAGIALVLIVIQILVIRALVLPIAGSYVPRIDRDLTRALRFAGTFLWLALVPPLVFAIILAFPGGEGTLFWLVAFLGLLAPLAVVVSVVYLRRAHTSWLELAERLVGKT